ncbi:hypothetical protein KP509_29G043000 [Ceratopteris richardii]|uniref:Uncharacterized protein n=1 Tax=Ceratopteris richardii TaxID=49495 RepID=A0A8T2R6I6_CERRI|nr:hypothetical protein KP509_29G043000 [Ceratopteris richardii]
MDTMPIKRTRVQIRDQSQEEGSSMGTQTKKGRVAKGEASKRKRRPRRKITMEDFPLGKDIEPYDLIEDISTQKPNITWPQLLQLSSKTRRERSKLVSTRRAKNKEINLIRANALRADQKWGAVLLVLKPNDRTKSITYDLKDQKKDHKYETTIDEESSCYDSDSSSEESTMETDSSTLEMLAEDLISKEKTMYINMLKRYPKLFIKDYNEIQGVTAIQYHIKIKPEVKPVAQKLRRIGTLQQEALLNEPSMKRDLAVEHYMNQAEKSRQEFNRKLKDKGLTEGTLVLRYDNRFDNRHDTKFQPRWEGPFLIKKKFKNGSYQLMYLSGKVQKTKVLDTINHPKQHQKCVGKTPNGQTEYN